jgi:starch-binding outer membrane protein, SusD/RagB family
MKNRIMKGKLIIAITILTLGSCGDDFLDRKPKGQLTYDTFFTTEAQAIESVNAIYNKFRVWDLTGLPYLGATDIISDDADKGSTLNDGLYLLDVDNFIFDATNGVMSAAWRGSYQTIFRANLSINNIPKMEIDPVLKARLVGEAKFLRAFSYYRLSQWFGEVPIITDQLTEDAYFNQKRAPQADVYKLIIDDLKAAAASCPVRSKYASKDLGRITSGAAQGLLAKVYLTQKDYNNCIQQCEAVINTNEYALTSSYAEIFTQAGDQNAESMFEISAAAYPAGVAGPGASPYNMVQGVRGVPNLGWGFNRPSDNLVASYESGDPRRQATILFVGEVLPDGSAKVEDNPEILNERYNQKAWVPSHAGLQDNGPGNLKHLRYADVLLLAAEAYNETGNTAKALQYVNQIRKRARGSNNFILPDLTVTEKDKLREAIRKERRVELAMEQQRWFDLVRYGNIGSVMRALGKKFVDNKHELLPIPQTEIDLSGGNLKQNPGY